MATFDVWVPEDGEEPGDNRLIEAVDAEAAAEAFADERDRDGDYTCVAGTPVTVLVHQKDAAGDYVGPVKSFTVTGESIPSYSARELTVAQRLEPVILALAREIDEDVYKSLHEHLSDAGQTATRKRLRALGESLAKALAEAGLSARGG